MPRDAHVALSVLNKAARRLIVELLIIKRSHLKRFPHHAYVNVSHGVCMHVYIYTSKLVTVFYSLSSFTLL